MLIAGTIKNPQIGFEVPKTVANAYVAFDIKEKGTKPPLNIHTNMPEPLGPDLMMKMFVDAGCAGDCANRRSRTKQIQ